MVAFRRLLPLLKPYWRWALAAPVLMVFEVAMDLVQPRLMQDIIDHTLPSANVQATLHYAGWMVVAAITGLFFGVGCGVFANLAGVSFGADLRTALMTKVQSLAHAELDHWSTGALVTRLTNDVEQVQEAAMMSMRIMVRAPVTMVGALAMAVYTYPSLSWLILVMMPLFFVAFWTISRRGHALFLAVQAKLDQLNVIFRENLAGSALVRIFLRSAHERQRFGRANDELRLAGVDAGVMAARIWPVIILTLNLGTVGALWLGGWQVHRGQAQIGQLLAFTQYLAQMLFSLMMVAMVLVRLIQAGASAERLVGVLDTQPSIVDPPQPAAHQPWRGAVRYESVSFTYPGQHAEPALVDISFDLAPGETLAVVGATGSGKSTLANLLPRFYDPQSGRILLDGLDLRALNVVDLRAAVSIVPQVPNLFSISVADNIRFGRPEATLEEVRAAAELAQATDFIDQLPDGFDHELEAQGTNLSGGQRQRLAIARALCCRPAVLVLDDCTSALDAGTEARLLAALASWDQPCSKLVVAQRLGAIRAADRVLVLKDGRVDGLGRHDELLESCQTYRDIVWAQANAPGDADA